MYRIGSGRKQCSARSDVRAQEDETSEQEELFTDFLTGIDPRCKVSTKSPRQSHYLLVSFLTIVEHQWERGSAESVVQCFTPEENKGKECRWPSSFGWKRVKPCDSRTQRIHARLLKEYVENSKINTQVTSDHQDAFMASWSWLFHIPRWCRKFFLFSFSCAARARSPQVQEQAERGPPPTPPSPSAAAADVARCRRYTAPTNTRPTGYRRLARPASGGTDRPARPGTSSAAKQARHSEPHRHHYW